MEYHIQTLVRHFFQKERLQDVTQQELQQFSTSYPYSAAGQFLLTQKLKAEGREDYEAQAIKTALYFNNPLWLHVLVQEQYEDPVMKPESRVAQKKSIPGFNLEQLPATAHESTGSHIVAPPADVMEEEPAATVPVEAVPVETIPVQEESVETVTETVVIEVIEIEEIPPAPVISVAPGVIAPVHETVVTAAPAAEEMPLPVTETPVTTTPLNEGQAVAQPETPVPAEPSVTAATTTPAEPGSPAADTPPDQAPVSNVTFEPYHTIDYFASQGIKLKLDDQSKDKLTRQLKSFTEWLRSMKKIIPASEEMAAGVDEATQQHIQQFAQHSVEGKEIVTEAMAEVWAKQGHLEKAIAIYGKLSLLNPAKSAYFAGKVQQLKDS